jgi:cytochrome c
MRIRNISSILVPVAMLTIPQAIGSQTPTAAEGRTLFEKRCTGCHTPDHEKVGPPLQVSSQGGIRPSFPYSNALKKSQLVWNPVMLEKWLTDPEALIPDNDMSFRLNNAQERAAIVAFLKETAK